MPKAQARGWRRHLVYRTECLKTTWKLRLALLLLVGLAVGTTRGLWAPALGRSLVCADDVARSDVILVENFDPSYLVFERAAALQDAGLAMRVLVPVEASGQDPESIDRVSRSIAELMLGLARVRDATLVPTRDREPISLNAAYQIREVLAAERLTSVIVVAPALRSLRSSLVYRAVLTPAGIQVHCAPVLGEHTPENWTATWHGIQDVTEQLIKLQYYRLYVLPLSRVRP